MLTSSTDQIVADSILAAFSEKDSIIHSPVYKIDSNHKSHSIHPYFLDSYRLIRDMRRLVRMFDHRAVNGYESMSDLVNICRKLPVPKQKDLIGTAMAGAVVNFISEATNKQLKKGKINFLQWRLEKVIFRNRFKYFSMNLQTGMNSRGIGFYIPALRVHYYRYATPYYAGQNITFYPMRKIGVNCGRWNGSIIITPFILSNMGTMALSYDKDRKIIHTRFELRKSSSIIIRFVHINYLERVNSDRILSEVLICW
ncbi:MAG: hypothetical protein JSW07_07185 [bacterium]|nr:MAG: hypothetical protein JSW07_07185 [bacterium]